jgi:hypothetical protein
MSAQSGDEITCFRAAAVEGDRVESSGRREDRGGTGRRVDVTMLGWWLKSRAKCEWEKIVRMTVKAKRMSKVMELRLMEQSSSVSRRRRQRTIGRWTSV